MTLPAGTRLGPYEITGSLGAGGMGEVYKARDTRLDRTVAIKVLPKDFVSDPDRRQRFEREARLVGSLSHPHICALHDVGTESSRAYLVMEYLEGQTLADRLARGALPLAETIRYGRDLAMALDAAHRQHIVHRDLKPGNIMLTRSGVKLLDFGLAKAADPLFHDTDGLSTRALTNVTSAGAIMGTVPYMAPEQVEGRPADWRSDIFALGAVLYEMATGHRAFSGASSAAIASAVLTSEPSPIAAAPALDRIIRRCIDKDPERRWQSAHDVAIQLEEASDPVAEAASLHRLPAWLPWTVAAVSLIAAAIAWAGRDGSQDRGDSAVISGAIAFPLPPPPGGAFTQSVEWIAAAVSPDGRAIAYSARDVRGQREDAHSGRAPDVKLWLRQLDSPDARPLAGTDGATSMFWSPDGRWLGFFAAGRLKRIEVAAGNAPLTICEVGEGIGQMGTWGADGRILFATVQGDALMTVLASGGTPTDLRKPEPGGRLAWPHFLPDGRTYLYLQAFPDDSGVVMFAAEGEQPRQILDVKSNVQYVDPGYLLFTSDGGLVARRFDAATGTVTGDLIAVAERVSYLKATGLAHFAASRTGVVAYQPHHDEARIVSFARTGREVATIRPAGENLGSLSISRDARRLLFGRLDPRIASFDIWMLDLERGVETRVTNDPRTDSFPLWGPSGTLIFSVARGSPPRLFRRHLDSGKEEELSPPGVRLQMPTSVSPDGQFLVYAQRTPRGNFDLMLRRLADNQTLPFRESAADESDGRFSPDGRLLAYTSDESGRYEVFVAPFPNGPATTVSTGGGQLPRWAADGRELFYIGAEGDLMAVPIRTTPAVEVGTAARLFSTGRSEGSWASYQVTSDGRFLALVRTQIGSQRPMTVIVNWPASLSR